MKIETIAVVNVSDSFREFAMGVYMCPNTKDYSFARKFHYIGGWNKGNIEYIGKVRAKGTIEKRDGKPYISSKSYAIAEVDTIDNELIKMFYKAVEKGVYKMLEKILMKEYK